MTNSEKTNLLHKMLKVGREHRVISIVSKTGQKGRMIKMNVRSDTDWDIVIDASGINLTLAPEMIQRAGVVHEKMPV